MKAFNEHSVDMMGSRGVTVRTYEVRRHSISNQLGVREVVPLIGPTTTIRFLRVEKTPEGSYVSPVVEYYDWVFSETVLEKIIFDNDIDSSIVEALQAEPAA